MTSNGGTLPADGSRTLPVLSMLSGPAAGVIAARSVGTAAGYPDVITCDMGGTSTDVCLVRGGEFGMTTEGRVGAFPVKMRQIDINSIGAGGGSIASMTTGSADRRAALGRRPARPRLLRPGRHGADRNGRQRGARAARHGRSRSAARSALDRAPAAAAVAGLPRARA